MSEAVHIAIPRLERLLFELVERYGDDFKPYAWDILSELAAVQQSKPSPLKLTWREPEGDH